jgi:hypothetical protein
MRTVGWAALLLVCAAGAGGCGREYRTEADRFANLTEGTGYDGGLVVCVSGAGGVTGEVGRIRQGLVEGGVQCAIESFEWSTGWVLADQADIIAILKSLSVERGVTVITATHDHKMLSNSDRVLWMRDGQVDRIDLREDLDIQEGGLSVNP